MDPAELRVHVSQLADDLLWLEEHARKRNDAAFIRGRLRLVGAMVRNVVGPYLDGQPPLPLHIAVVGGAGAGKSTIANWLIGDMVAESNPQAGYTRHPIAYGKPDMTWPQSAGFLGTLTRLDRNESARLDEDVYQLRRIGSGRPEEELLSTFVIWDCPDVTTYAASHYTPRVLEIAGLADVIVYVASDERYNDEVPTEYLKLFLEAGKMVVTVLVKLREPDIPAFLAHFQREVVSKLPAKPLAIVAVPQLTREQLAEPFEKASKWRIPLINQVRVLGQPPERGRKHSAEGAMRHLHRQQDKLLEAAREDLAALDDWRTLVQEGQMDFSARYRKEYLTAERFRRFDETLFRLLELLEVPVVGRVVSQAMNVLRMPYTFLRGWFKKQPAMVMTPALQEKPVLEAAMKAWVDHIRKTAAVRRDQHPLWRHVSDGFQHGLSLQADDNFDRLAAAFQTSLAEEVERTARAMLEDLQKRPVALNSLRSAKFALDLTAVAGGIALGGFSPLSIVLVPIAASMSQYLVDLMGEGYVSMRREETRSRQQTLFNERLAQPIADWLINWPTSGGSSYQQLQAIVRRFPDLVGILEKAVARH